MSCQYPNCTEPETTQFSNCCIFHAPVEKKDFINEIGFNNLITKKINDNNFNFEGYIFPYFYDFSIRNNYMYTLNFKNAEFHGSKSFPLTFLGTNQSNNVCANFSNITFNQSVDFTDCKFIGGAFACNKSKFLRTIALFKNASFNGVVSFENTDFHQCDIDFSNCKFQENVSFKNIDVDSKNPKQNSTNALSFVNAMFRKNAYFNSASIKIKHFQFNNAHFKGKLVTFDKLNAVCEKIDFYQTIFECDTFQFRNANIASLLFYFHETKFKCDVTLKDSKFSNSITNESPYLNIRNCEFTGIDVTFENVEFNSGKVYFNDTLFECEVSFLNTIFQNGADFNKTKFKSNKNNQKTNANFTNTVVNSKDINFLETEFLCDEVIFQNNLIKGDLYFSKNKFKKELILGISDLRLDENSKFNLEDPLFDEEMGFNFIITFENITFNPLKTIFRNIYKNESLSRDISNDRSIEFAIVFRSCLLKDVYFINNEISNFSFYKSIFEEALFDTFELNYKTEKILFFNYKRKDIIFEDYFSSIFRNKPKVELSTEKKKYILEESFGSSQISDIYRKLKKKSDDKKDYKRAANYYFNEFEMERLANDKSKNMRYFVNSTYKVFAGYGEKPLWSLLWILCFTIIFTTAHLFLGFKIKSTEVQYFLFKDNTFFHFGTYLLDIVKSFIFTLSRIIPLSYFQLDVKSVESLTDYGLIVSFINAFVLFVLFTFLLIGLKRHFRRY